MLQHAHFQYNLKKCSKEAVSDPGSIIDEIGLNIFTQQLEMIAQTEENRNANDSSTADDISQVNIIWFKKKILQEFLGRLLYFY